LDGQDIVRNSRRNSKSIAAEVNFLVRQQSIFQAALLFAAMRRGNDLFKSGIGSIAGLEGG
jgi:hypothetical protein